MIKNIQWGKDSFFHMWCWKNWAAASETMKQHRSYYAQKLTQLFGLSLKYMRLDFCFIDYAKAFDRVDHKKLWKAP